MNEDFGREKNSYADEYTFRRFTGKPFFERRMREKTMTKKKVDCNWQLFEFPLEELEMILKASSNAEDTVELDNSQEDGGSHV